MTGLLWSQTGLRRADVSHRIYSTISAPSQSECCCAGLWPGVELLSTRTLIYISNHCLVTPAL